MMYKLRPYQKKAIDEFDSLRSSKSRLLMVLPTGAGKTVIFSSIAKRFIEDNKRVLILAHRVELAEQTAKTLSRLGLSPTEYNAKIKKTSRLTVGMVETAKRSTGLLNRFDLVIIDEAHRGEFNNAFSFIPQHTLILGVTATPIAAKIDEPLKNYYHDLIIGPDIPQLIAEGNLCSVVTYAPKGVNVGKLSSQMGEYTDQSQIDALSSGILHDGIIDCYRSIGQKKAICFCVDVAHSKATAEKFVSDGINARHVDGTMGKVERDGIVNWFRSTDGAVICNCDILTAGFDEESIEVVIFNRITQSLPLWLQAQGRGSRPIKGKKDKFYVIDAGGNYIEHGTWDEHRDWEKTFYHPRKKRERMEIEETPVPSSCKPCKVCFALIPSSARSCRVCGASLVEVVIDNGYKQVVAKNPLLSMSTSRMTVSQLVERAKIGSRDGRPYKFGWCKHQILARCRTYEQVLQELTELQQLIGEANDYAIYWTNRWQKG